MTTITLEVPDELASRLAPLRAQLPMLLTRMVATLPPADTSAADRASAAQPAWTEAMDFLAGGPTRDEILAFKFSADVQERVEALLEKNREGPLDDAERVEFDGYEMLNALMILLKARARRLPIASAA